MRIFGVITLSSCKTTHKRLSYEQWDVELRHLSGFVELCCFRVYCLGECPKHDFIYFYHKRKLYSDRFFIFILTRVSILLIISPLLKDPSGLRGTAIRTRHVQAWGTSHCSSPLNLQWKKVSLHWPSENLKVTLIKYLVLYWPFTGNLKVTVAKYLELQ